MPHYSLIRPSLPENIYIEISSYCNLRCSHCYRENYSYSSKDKLLSYDSFRTIINQIRKSQSNLTVITKPRLYLHGLGEPTLNPNLKKMIAYAKKTNSFNSIEFVSNLTTESPEKTLQYFDAGLDKLYVSLDYVDTVDNLPISKRVGSNPHDVIRNISEISKVIDLSKVAVITTIGKINEESLKLLSGIILDLGIQEWCIQRMINFKNGEYCRGELTIPEIYNFVKTFTGNKVVLSIDGLSSFKCSQPFSNLVINSMGFVTPCCLLFDHNLINFGNVFSKSCIEIFQSEIFEKFRSEFKQSKPKVCSICPMYIWSCNDSSEKLGYEK